MRTALFRARLRWWLWAFALPVLIVQAFWLRKTVPRLPQAAGPDFGDLPGGRASVSIIFIGESTVAGVGVAEHRQGIACQSARLIAEKTGAAVSWRAIGENGATAERALTRVRAERLAPDSVVYVVLGVNDSLRLTRSRRWRTQISALIKALAQAGTADVVLVSVPPLSIFSALPFPAARVLGAKSRVLDLTLQALAAEHDHAVYMNTVFPVGKNYLAADGFHPSATGYTAWAEQIRDFHIARFDVRNINPAQI